MDRDDRPLASAVALRELPRSVRWLRVVCGLRGEVPWFWLDSALVDARLGRFSFAGAEPSFVLRAFGTRCEVEWRRAAGGVPAPARWTTFGDPFDVARRLLPPPPADGAPLPLPFVGGAVALLAYELADLWEALPAPPPDAMAPPDLVLLGVDRLYACDHLEGRVYATALATARDAAEAQRRARAAVDDLSSARPDADPSPLEGAFAAPASRDSAGARSDLSAEAYAKAVTRVRERIAAGDVYQACLTRRVDARLAADAFELYATLRRRNPAPFAGFVALPGLCVASSSPERFLQVTPGRWVETRPIKGTRPRGATPERDAALRAELAASEKDRAENVMIVDLARNDLGRVCEPGSVHVPELFAVEPYATVFQLVSTVRGRLAPGEDAWSAVRAAFPPGSMTGAPKLAALSLLRELEPARRGFYAGALGYFDVRGGCDLSVLIRTWFAQGTRAWLHTGGGVVHDSDPRAEWDESEDKARALLDALAATNR
jgi:para-aminobenzoate synthetase component 1